MLDNNTDLPGRQRFKTTFNSFLRLPQNSNINNMFTVDSVLIFRIGECKLNEVIYSKGHPTNPAQGSWSIINENQYLKIILHETNGVNSLVFKSTTQILNTDRRITIGINFFDATSNIELFVNSLPVLCSLDTSQGNYRTNINQFTGLRVTSDDVLVGRGTGLVYGEFGLYYDACETRVLTQSEHNVYYQPLIDARPVVPQGKIIFGTNRDGNENIYEMNEDGTNTLYKVGTGLPEFYPNYSNSGNGYTYTLNTTTWQGKYVKDDNTVITVPSMHSSSLRCQLNNAGTEIYYSSDIGGGFLFKYTIVGGIETDLNAVSTSTNLVNWYQVFYDLNPVNNNKILFARLRPSFTNTLIVRDLTTGIETVIMTTPYTPTSFDNRFINAKFSPDGTKIAFDVYHANDGSDFRIYTCNANGTDLKLIQISNISNPTYFNSWSPDGTKLLLSKKASGVGYTNRFQLFTRDLSTNFEKQLTAHNSDNTAGDWKA